MSILYKLHKLHNCLLSVETKLIIIGPWRNAAQLTIIHNFHK